MGRTSDARERLVRSIAGLVHERGYRTVSVEDICKDAGVQKGSFYYFFRSKRALMQAALEMRWETGRDQFLKVAFASDVPPLKRIERFFTMVADAEVRTKKTVGHVLGCPFGNISAEVGAKEKMLRKQVDAAFCGMAGFVRAALAEAQSAGDMPPSVDLDQAADSIVAFFEGVALLAKTRNDPGVIRRLGPQAVRLAGATQGATRTPKGSRRSS